MPGGRLRVLMVIARPAETGDVPPYRMIARRLLDAVRGEVDLVVLRPASLDALRDALARGSRKAGRSRRCISMATAFCPAAVPAVPVLVLLLGLGDIQRCCPTWPAKGCWCSRSRAAAITCRLQKWRRYWLAPGCRWWC
jgi:hypothetical protein